MKEHCPGSLFNAPVLRAGSTSHIFLLQYTIVMNKYLGTSHIWVWRNFKENLTSSLQQKDVRITYIINLLKISWSWLDSQSGEYKLDLLTPVSTDWRKLTYGQKTNQTKNTDIGLYMITCTEYYVAQAFKFPTHSNKLLGRLNCCKNKAHHWRLNGLVKRSGHSWLPVTYSHSMHDYQ